MSCKTKKCGCLDTGLTTPTSCVHDTVECPNPNLCSETFSDCCVIHANDTIVDVGFNQGESMCSILQKIALLITNPGCVLPGAVCQSALNFHSILITPTIINLAWDNNPTAVTYNVEYREISSMTWLLNPALVNTAFPTDTIGGLLPSTSYYVRVSSICASSTCYSVTLLITTKPS